MCCLGVACDLYRKTCGGEWDGLSFKLPNGKSASGFLDTDIKNWLGLQTLTGAFRRLGGTIDTLANCNDTGASFSEIADIIESEPEELFQCLELLRLTA